MILTGLDTIIICFELQKQKIFLFSICRLGHKALNGVSTQLCLSNEDKFQVEIHNLDLEGIIFIVSIVQLHAMDATKMHIASRNKRGKWQPWYFFGIHGGHSLKKNKISGGHVEVCPCCT
jgi:hypothetical protein